MFSMKTRSFCLAEVIALGTPVRPFGPGQLRLNGIFRKVSSYQPPPKRSQLLSHPTSNSPANPNWRRGLLVLGGIVITLTTAYGSFTVVRKLKEEDVQPKPDNAIPEDVSNRYSRTAQQFDSNVDLQEMLMGMGWLRSWLTSRAWGNALECSAGTGRNSAYYDMSKCNTITLLDQSQEMIEIAKKKFKEARPGVRSCRFVVQSAHDPITAPPGGFDTVLQTMGLCSIVDPVQLLRHLGDITNAEHGQILLLEHGRSHYDWLNRILDRSAPAHADKHGCWWNKDIQSVVDESGLEVVEIKRYHLGTTWWIELRPARCKQSASDKSKA